MFDDDRSRSNPAGRLHAILSVAKQSQNQPAVDAWSAVAILAGYSQSRAELFRFLSDVMRLADEVTVQVSAIENENTDLALRHHDQVLMTVANFPMMGAMDIASFMNPCSDVALFGLELCSDILYRRGRRLLITKQDKLRLTENLSDLMTSIQESDLSDEDKEYILERLEAVDDALRHANVIGYERVMRETDSLAGYVARQRTLGRMQDSPLVRTLVGFVLAVDVALNMGANYQALTSGPAVQVEINNHAPGFQLPAPPVVPAPEETDDVTVEPEESLQA